MQVQYMYRKRWRDLFNFPCEEVMHSAANWELPVLTRVADVGMFLKATRPGGPCPAHANLLLRQA
jgi:hypothetical protein